MRKYKMFCLWRDEDNVQFETIDECIDYLQEEFNFKLLEVDNDEDLDKQAEMVQALIECYFIEREFKELDEEDIERARKEAREERQEREREYRQMQGF